MLDYLFERHADNDKVDTESTICFESDKSIPGIHSENKILGDSYRLSEDGNFIASGKACKVNCSVQADTREQRHHGPKIYLTILPRSQTDTCMLEVMETTC